MFVAVLSKIMILNPHCFHIYRPLSFSLIERPGISNEADRSYIANPWIMFLYGGPTELHLDAMRHVCYQRHSNYKVPVLHSRTP